jgi:hypothetical protein
MLFLLLVVTLLLAVTLLLVILLAEVSSLLARRLPTTVQLVLFIPAVTF